MLSRQSLDGLNPMNAILMNAFQGKKTVNAFLRATRATLMTTEFSPYEWNFWYECDFHRRTAGVDDASEWKNGPSLHDYCDEFARSAPAGTVALQAADVGVEWLGQ
jgi:hypothetical protein